MADHPRDRRIAAHIESISARAEPDTARLVSAILRVCWPECIAGSAPSCVSAPRRSSARGEAAAPGLLAHDFTSRIDRPRTNAPITNASAARCAATGPPGEQRRDERLRGLAHLRD